jgi:hypothetical protein
MRSFRKNRKKLKFHPSKLPPPLDVHMPKTNQLFNFPFRTQIWNCVSIRSAVWPLWWIQTDGYTDGRTYRPTVKNHFFGIREVQNGYIHKNLDIDFLTKTITFIIVKKIGDVTIGRLLFLQFINLKTLLLRWNESLNCF